MLGAVSESGAGGGGGAGEGVLHIIDLGRLRPKGIGISRAEV